MKTRTPSFFIPIVLISVPLSAFAAPVVLDFETGPAGTPAAHGDRLPGYAAHGIQFVNPLEVVRCEAGGGNNTPHCTAARSGDNMVRPILKDEFRRHLINVRFAAGQDSVTGYLRFDGDAAFNGREVHAVMNAFDEADAFLGSATVNFVHNTGAPAWNTITKSVVPPLFGEPVRKIRRIEIWGGLSSANSPPTRDLAENFLLLDDLTFEPVVLPGDTTRPTIFIHWPPNGWTVSSDLVTTSITARDETRLQSVDFRAVHESGYVTAEFTGGNICGGPGVDGCPAREFSNEFRIPLSSVHPGTYTVAFRACDAAGNCRDSSINIVLNIPGRIEPGSFTPPEGIPTTLRHTADDSVYPGTEVTLTGENFHDRMTVFFYDCPEVPPLSDRQLGEDYFEMPIVEGSLRTDLPGGVPDEVKVVVPDLPDIVDGKPYSIVIRDGWLRDGVTPGTISQWRLFGPPGTCFRIRLPEYPRMHGFNFVNDGGPASWRMFTAVFGRDAFARVIRCRPRLMYSIYYLIFQRLVRESNGSCVGMASTSRRFANETLWPEDLGAGYAFALPGGGVDDAIDDYFPCPPRPAEFHREGLCGPWRPQNLWSVIRRNHGAQFSHQFLNEILEQLPDLLPGIPGGGSIPRYGDPVAALERVRRNLSGYVLCMRRQGGGHCVTPYQIHDGVRYAWGERTGESYGEMIEDPDYTAIKMYDNSYPGGTDRWININRLENTFQYKWEERGNSEEMHFKYHGKGLLTIPIGLWDRDLTRPMIVRDGIRWLLHFVAGDADVMHENAGGRRWGWKPDGTFIEEYPGGYDVPGFHGDDDDLRDHVFCTAPADAPARSLINVRGPDYYFHADQGNTMLQLHVTDGVAGDQDRVQMQKTGGRLSSFEYFPDSARASFTPTVAMEFNDNEAGSFAWSGLNLLKGESAAFEALPDSKAVRLANNSPRPARYTLTVNSEDETTGLAQTKYFGPFDLPAGAAQKVVLHRWPGLDEVRSELHLDNDGVADEVEILQGNPSPDPTNTFMGVPYTPEGNAIVQKDNQGNLRVGGLQDEDGGDGIAFHFGGANAVRVSLGQAPQAGETPTGAFQALAIRDWAGATLAVLESGDAGDHFRHRIDFGRVGSETAEIRMSYRGAPVLNLTGHSGPVTGPAGIGGSLTVSILANGRLAITLSWNQAVLLGTGNANPFLADSIMWISEAPNSVVKLNSLDQLILSGYLVPPLAITAVSGEPFMFPDLGNSLQGAILKVFWKRQDGLQLIASPDLINWGLVQGTLVQGDTESYQTALDDGPRRRFFKLRSIAE